MSVIIRPEQQTDCELIRKVTDLAFAGRPYSSGKESQTVDKLRKTDRMTASLVATQNGQIVGHVAVSPVLIDGKEVNWFALGPVSVLPANQGQGIGSLLVKAALQVLSERHAHGCVELGNPDFYARFGFEKDASLIYKGASAEFFQRVVISGPAVSGEVTFDKAFDG